MTAPQPKSSPLTFWIIVAVLLGGFGIYVARHYASSNPTNRAPTQVSGAGADSVSYALTGTASTAKVMLITPTGTSSIDAPSGAVYTYTFSSGTTVRMAAQNDSTTGTVGCTITVNGTQLDTETAPDPSSVVECDAVTP